MVIITITSRLFPEMASIMDATNAEDGAVDEWVSYKYACILKFIIIVNLGLE